VTGSNFVAGASVTIDGLPAIDVAIHEGTITAVTPAHADGPVDLVVINPDGQKSVLSGGFSYQGTPVVGTDTANGDRSKATTKPKRPPGNYLQLTELSLDDLAAMGTNPPTAADVVKRREHLQNALTARQKGEHQLAANEAGRARSIHGTPTIRLFMAEEQAAFGQFDNAWFNAEQCIKEGETQTAFVQRVSQCKSLESAMMKKLGRVTVLLPSPLPPDIEVKIATHVIAEVNYDKQHFFRPGNVRVEASAPGYEAFRKEYLVKAGQEQKAEVSLPRLAQHR